MTEILSDTAAGVTTLTLNRPDVLNSFTRSMARELRDAIERIAADDSVRAVVLTGAGRGFCAGQDLAEAAPKDGAMPDLGDIVRDSYNPVIRAIRTLEKPVLCAVNGVAAGRRSESRVRVRHRVRVEQGNLHSIVREDRRHS